MSAIQESSPQQVGLPSSYIESLINQLDTYQLPIHSLLIAKNNQLIFETYYGPLEKNGLHRLFSVSKSLVGLAIGHLVSTNKIALSDPIIRYFPEWLPTNIHPYLYEMTIEDMLTMKTCHHSTTFKINPANHWVESFFTTPPTHPPGKFFNYDTSSSHVLCALVEKLTNQSILDYLRLNVLKDTGFSQDAYMIQDPFGCNMGGSGLMATTRDFLIIALLYLNKGNWQNESRIDNHYMNKAIAYHSNTLFTGPILEERYGYGYQVWLISKGGFVLYGMGGQLAICYPKLDLIVVITADTQGIQGGNQLIYEAVKQTLLEPLISNAPIDWTNESLHYSHLLEKASQLRLKPLEFPTPICLSDQYSDRLYVLEKNESGFTGISLKMSDTPFNGGSLVVYKDSKPLVIPFGIGEMVSSRFPFYDQKCYSSGLILSSQEIMIKSNLIDEHLGTIYFHLYFEADHLDLYMKKIEETYYSEFSGFFHGNSY